MQPKGDNRSAMVQAWIDNYQKASRQSHANCEWCGWPHDRHLVCGYGSTFGRVRLGDDTYWVHAGNVESLQHFVENKPPGFHWRGEVFFNPEEAGVRVSRVEQFNNCPHWKSWLIPWTEWTSIVASVGMAEPSLPPVVPPAARSFDGWLCYAWGETDYPVAEFVRDRAGVETFIVREWLGDKDSRGGDGEPSLPGIMDEFDEHDWSPNEDPLTWEFEIGGVRIEKACGWLAASESAPPT